MEKKTIGTFLAALRKANGLTQKQLAEKLNVSDKAVSRWERDECAPDLSLIPVLAEIYGVTADEILRGQRRDPEVPTQSPDNTRAEKQLKQLVARVQTKFRIRSILAFAIAIVGIIAAAICNHGLNQAAIGFMVGCIFFVAAAVCQIIFVILGYSAVSTEDLDADLVAPCQKTMLCTTELIISAILVFLVGSTPLITLSEGHPYMGISADWVFEESLPYSLPTALACLIISYPINRRNGLTKTTTISAATRRLLVRCGAWLLGYLILIYAAQLCVNAFFLEQYHLYAPCQKFDTIEEFKQHMETPTDLIGKPMKLTYTESTTTEGKTPITFYHYVGTNDTEYILSDCDVAYLYYPTISYLNYNLSIEHIEVSNAPDHVPIYTFTYEQFAYANTVTMWVNIIFIVFYLCGIVATIVIFKKKQIAQT